MASGDGTESVRIGGDVDVDGVGDGQLARLFLKNSTHCKGLDVHSLVQAKWTIGASPFI